MDMKRLQLLGVAALSAISISTIAAQSGQPSVNTPVTQLHYGATGVTDGVHGELNAAPAFGDLTHGPHGTFIKMPAGFVSQGGKFDYVPAKQGAMTK